MKELRFSHDLPLKTRPTKPGHNPSPYLNVLQRYDSSGLFVCRVLEVIEAVVVEDEPSPLPRLVAAALLHEPALAVRVEERVHEVVAVVLGDLEGLRLDALVQALRENGFG